MDRPTVERVPAAGVLVKEHLASRLRDEIMRGRLTPGERVVEGRWARELGVAQASVREAINLLVGEGFVTKEAGRSARVTQYTERDVKHIYQVRGVLEGLAAELVTAQKTPLDRVVASLAGMEDAIAACDMRALIRCDLNYHVTLCELSGNPFLFDSVRRLLIPLFAFVLVRVMQSGQGVDAWAGDLPRHRRMIEIMLEGDPVVARQYVQHCVSGFVTSAYEVWQNVDGSVEARREGAPRRDR